MIGANKTAPVPRGARWKNTAYSQQFTTREAVAGRMMAAECATHSLVVDGSTLGASDMAGKWNLD
jgi:hypothetical protein